MYEHSFFLLKPNKIDSVEVYDFLIKELCASDLVINDEWSQKITPWHMCNLWPRLFKDILLYYANIELFRHDSVKVIEISGENAISKTLRIKKLVRSVYANSIIRNCVHSPANTQEYETQMNAIRSNNDNFKPKFIDLPFKSFSNLNDETCRSLAKTIIDVSLYTMIPYITPFYLSDKKYRCYLIEDEIHTFADYVCFISDYLQQYNIFDATIYSMILLANGEACLFDDNDASKIKFIVESGKKHGLIVKSHKVT